MTLQEMKQAQKVALEAANAVVTAAETGNRSMTDAENETYNNRMAEYRALGTTAKAREEQNTIHSAFGPAPVIEGRRGVEVPSFNSFLSAEYRRDFAAFLKTGVVTESLQAGFDPIGKGFKFAAVSAANYEGGASSGAPLFQTAPVDQNIIALAPPEMGIQKLATVIPTTMDLPMSRKKAHGTAAAKAEGDGTGTNLFAGTSPQTEKFTLSAFMVGHAEDASWELLQDVQTFQSFLTGDILLSLAILKEGWFVNGTGNGQAQGIKGNVADNITGIAAGTDNYASELLDSTFDVMGQLNAVYHPGAAWLMARATSISLRKAQKQANLFEPVFVRVGGQDYLHGYPVEYSTSVDAIGAGNVPVYFGDFKAGYIIGERGGSGVNVKILDQPKAKEGLLEILGYQRVDARVRRSEAIQSITLHV